MGSKYLANIRSMQLQPSSMFIAGMTPRVAQCPTTPHITEGIRMLPPISDPSSMGVKPAARAAADPPEDPPGDRFGQYGFPVRPKMGLFTSQSHALMGWFVLPRRIAPPSSINIFAASHFCPRW